jgi:hypothetical protein
MHLIIFHYLEDVTFRPFNIQLVCRSPLCLVVFIPKPLFNHWFVFAYVPLLIHCFQYMVLDQSLSIVIIVYSTKLMLCLGGGLSSLTWYLGVLREDKSCICVCTCTNLFGVHVNWLCSSFCTCNPFHFKPFNQCLFFFSSKLWCSWSGIHL